MHQVIRRAGLGFLGLLLVAGCNVLAPTYTEGGTVEALLEDARHARARGDYHRAVQLLEQAYEQAPSHRGVRLDLASSLLQREGITLRQMERVLNHLLDARHGARAVASRLDEPMRCSFADGAETQPFDPRTAEDYDILEEARPTLEFVLELLTDPGESPGEPAMPDEFTNLQVCEAITETGLDYDRAGVRSALYRDFASQDAVTSALSSTAVAVTIESFVALFEQPDLAAEWFIVNGEEVGVCVPEAQYDLLVERARNEVTKVGRGVFAIDLLATGNGGSGYEELAGDVLDLYHTIKATAFDPCDAE